MSIKKQTPPPSIIRTQEEIEKMKNYLNVVLEECLEERNYEKEFLNARIADLVYNPWSFREVGDALNKLHNKYGGICHYDEICYAGIVFGRLEILQWLQHHIIPPKSFKDDLHVLTMLQEEDL